MVPVFFARENASEYTTQYGLGENPGWLPNAGMVLMVSMVVCRTTGEGSNPFTCSTKLYVCREWRTGSVRKDGELDKVLSEVVVYRLWIENG